MVRWTLGSLRLAASLVFAIKHPEHVEAAGDCEHEKLEQQRLPGVWLGIHSISLWGLVSIIGDVFIAEVTLLSL